jgi:hypothetical protein
MKLIDSDKYNAVKLVSYDEYNEKRSPRSILGSSVANATITDVFLGVALVGAKTHTQGNPFDFAFPLVFALLSGARALQGTLVALHNCPPSNKSLRDNAVP